MSALRFNSVIYGEFITLAKVTESDASYIYELRTSSSGSLLNHPKDYSVEKQREWIASRGNDEINYLIYDKDRGESVGMVSIYECNVHDRVSNCGRLLLEPKYIAQGSPYGLEALKICYGYIFNEMGFRKITGIIAGSNTKIIGLQQYLGMVQEGLMKGHALINGKYEDIHIFSLFKDQFGQYSSRIDNLLNKYR
jgi:RimJ/RimL family protein N-acetyltransferase